MTTAPGLHPRALDQLRDADRGDQDVGSGHLLGEVALAVTDRHRRVGVQEQERHGPAHQDAPAHHHRALPGGLALDLLEHPHHAPGGAGHGGLASLGQQTRVHRVQAVGILVRTEQPEQ
jgi:hypothetical protein